MVKILATDGLSPEGQLLLEEVGYELHLQSYKAEELATVLPNYDAVIVRSATKITRDLIEVCPNLKLIARGGVGTENIDVAYAQSKGIKVIDTPEASAQSVAELVFAHLFSLARNLHRAHREMPAQGDTAFKKLKKDYSQGFELRGKTLGILGFGRVGQQVARIAQGLGMQVLPVDLVQGEMKIDISIFNNDSIALSFNMHTVPLDQMLAKADIVTVHTPYTGKYLIGAAEFAKMKDGVVFIHAARGGIVDETALLHALNTGKVAAAGLDVFENEPTPRRELLEHSNVSLSPHIGASTQEAQYNIGLVLADSIIDFFGEV